MEDEEKEEKHGEDLWEELDDDQAGLFIPPLGFFYQQMMPRAQWKRLSKLVVSRELLLLTSQVQ